MVSISQEEALLELIRRLNDPDLNYEQVLQMLCDSFPMDDDTEMVQIIRPLIHLACDKSITPINLLMVYVGLGHTYITIDDIKHYLFRPYPLGFNEDGAIISRIDSICDIHENHFKFQSTTLPSTRTPKMELLSVLYDELNYIDDYIFESCVGEGKVIDSEEFVVRVCNFFFSCLPTETTLMAFVYNFYFFVVSATIPPLVFYNQWKKYIDDYGQRWKCDYILAGFFSTNPAIPRNIITRDTSRYPESWNIPAHAFIELESRVAASSVTQV